MVGTGRFELPTPRTPSECSTRLSHVPTAKRSHARYLLRTRGYSHFTSAAARGHPRRRGSSHASSPPSRARLGAASLAFRSEFGRGLGAFAEEIVLHLLRDELLVLLAPGLQAIFVQQHLLQIAPLGP